MRKTIAIDFDGTLCAECYPDIGHPNWDVISKAAEEQEKGAVLILWTCREGALLQDAIKACEKWGLHFDAINENSTERIQYYGNDCRKVGADEYWDDRSVPISGGYLDNYRDQKEEEQMKASGIIRRIDSLGRIEIPKAILKEKGLAEGTAIEIFTDRDGIRLERYYPTCDFCKEAIAKNVAGSINLCDECLKRIKFALNRMEEKK